MMEKHAEKSIHTTCFRTCTRTAMHCCDAATASAETKAKAETYQSYLRALQSFPHYSQEAPTIIRARGFMPLVIHAKMAWLIMMHAYSNAPFVTPQKPQPKSAKSLYKMKASLFLQRLLFLLSVHSVYSASMLRMQMVRMLRPGSGIIATGTMLHFIL